MPPSRFIPIATAIAALASTGTTADAIPPFARAYQVPCSTCHTAIARRTEFGDAFRKAGYRWPGATVSADNTQRAQPIEMKGTSYERGLLPAQLPVGLAANMSGTYAADSRVDDNLLLGSPSLLFLLGGSLSDNLSFFGTWSGQGSPNELVLHVARPVSNRPELNVRFGQLEPTTTLFKNNEALIGRYIHNSSALNGHAIGQSRLGVEANGIVLNRIFWAAGGVQNQGAGSHIDGYYHLSYKSGGMDLHATEPDLDLDSEPSAFEDLVVTMGHWGYFGEVQDTSGEALYRIRRIGLDAQVRFRNATVWGGLMLGFDRDVALSTRNRSVTSFAEASYSLTSWLMPMYLYQYQDAASFRKETQRHDVGVIVLPLENLRARLKYSGVIGKPTDRTVELQLVLGI